MRQYASRRAFKRTLGRVCVSADECNSRKGLVKAGPPRAVCYDEWAGQHGRRRGNVLDGTKGLMNIDLILILVLAALAALSVLRLVVAVRRSWDGTVEDLLEDGMIRRMVIAGLCVAAFLAAVLLRGSVKSAFALAAG